MLHPLDQASFRLRYWGHSQGQVPFLFSHLTLTLTLTLVLNLTPSLSISLVSISPGDLSYKEHMSGELCPVGRGSGSPKYPQKLFKRQTHLLDLAVSSWHHHSGIRQIRCCHSLLLLSSPPPKPEGSKATGSGEEMTLTFPWLLGQAQIGGGGKKKTYLDKHVKSWLIFWTGVVWLLDQTEVLIPKQGTVCLSSKGQDLPMGSSRGRERTNPRRMTEGTEDEFWRETYIVSCLHSIASRLFSESVTPLFHFWWGACQPRMKARSLPHLHTTINTALNTFSQENSFSNPQLPVFIPSS